MAYFASPAPVGGWNARDDLGNMPPEDAVRLVNWRPRPGFCETRKGATSLAVSNDTYNATGTIATFRSTFGDVLIFTGGERILAFDGSSVTTLVDSATLTGAFFWDTAHFQDRLIMTLGDGSQTAQVITYDGATVSTTDLNITTGPDEEDIRGVQVHKGRAYYWETASQSFWYAAAGAYQGDLTEFDLGTALRSGGALQMMLSISVDGGGGQDDLAAFVFSSGEVLLYQGDDPGDSAAWELVGSYEIGQPVDPQAHAKVAGTELVYTRDGVVDITEALKIGRFGDTAEFTNKITNAATEAARDNISQSGWQIVHAPGDNCIVLNIPTGAGDFAQYIRETDTGGWWECSGWNGRFAVFNDRLVMVRCDPGNNILRVSQCFDGLVDTVGAEIENPILTTAFPAFTTARQAANRKILTAVQPSTDYGTGSSLTITGRADFDTTIPSAPTNTSGSTAARNRPNISAFANGNFLSYVLRTHEAGQQIKWNSTTMFYDIGGPV